MKRILGLFMTSLCSIAIADAAHASTYALLLESNADEVGGDEVFGVTFDTYADTLASSASSSGLSQVDISPDFSIAGFAFDGFPDLSVAPDVPLPSGGLLLLSGLAGLAGVLRRKQAAA